MPAQPEPCARPLPINLATALRLAGARPVIIAAAQASVQVAAAELERLRVAWLPSVYVGAGYHHHDGATQGQSAAKKPAAAAVKKPAAPAAKQPAAKKKPFQDDEDGPATYGVVKEPEDVRKEEDPDYEDEDKPDITFGLDTSIQDPRGPASEMVAKPSNWLIRSGTIGFISWLLLLLIVLIPVQNIRVAIGFLIGAYATTHFSDRF